MQLPHPAYRYSTEPDVIDAYMRFVSGETAVTHITAAGDDGLSIDVSLEAENAKSAIDAAAYLRLVTGANPQAAIPLPMVEDGKVVSDPHTLAPYLQTRLAFGSREEADQGMRVLVDLMQGRPVRPVLATVHTPANRHVFAAPRSLQ